ncbi:MAG: polyprenyl synthetase family protein [Elusimicrobiales bacterium]|nr:polyprenyl synthetase family protein [Elusimicrobiales bacterium]
MDIEKYIKARALAVNAALPRFVRALSGADPRLAAAMTYPLAAGGKRLRPVLMGAAYEIFGGKAKDILPAACALEMVHTYSLVHDDLPAMDDDDLRRGRPTTHKVYGEAEAILAGDALLTDAFTTLLSARYPARVKPAGVLAAARIMAARAGARGMVSGQAADLAAEGFLKGKVTPARRRAGLKLLSYIHLHKTADLITAAVEMGAALAGAPARDLAALSAFGRDIGLCFQVADDVLDVVGDKKKLGKSGSDARNRKLTYASLFGVEEARRRAEGLMRRALPALARVRGAARPKAVLAEIAGFVYRRDN